MPKRILITGGAGFIGSHTADRLIERGYEVVIYDNLDPQVHDSIPDYLHPDAEFIEGDVRDRNRLHRVLRGVDAVCHLAAAVGIGQSMYDIEKYVDVNIGGTAVLLDLLVKEPDVRVEKVVIASSMSIYGEGEYDCPECGVARHPHVRSREEIRKGGWELHCVVCAHRLQPRPTRETSSLNPNSIYAITKRVQEEMTMMVGRAYGIPVVGLRYFNTYGQRQSLRNPYTGVCAIFSSRIKTGNPPILYEDGLQTRDFVHVRDVARANQLAIESAAADGQVLNVGTGRVTTVKEIAQALIHLYGKERELTPRIANQFREGDIRHCCADISEIQRVLRFSPEVSLSEGLQDLVNWGRTQQAADCFDQAQAELDRFGLVHSQ
jgi:dTDP-L-rhamnose 4-epimerase